MTDRWRDQARCLDASTNPGDWDMFPCDRNSPGSQAYAADVEKLRDILCWKCPVRVECLRDGMIEDYGMWGGLTAEDRKTVTQLDCSCGQPIDPRDLVSNVRHFCPNCKPIVFGRSSKV
jgi:predicted RNA-binding Zn-ribbon protein involved in translation (DUF1610 family)